MENIPAVGTHVVLTEDYYTASGCVTKGETGKVVERVPNFGRETRVKIKLDSDCHTFTIPISSLGLADDARIDAQLDPSPSSKAHIAPDFQDNLDDFAAYANVIKIMDSWTSLPRNMSIEQALNAVSLLQAQVSSLLVEEAVLRAKIKEWEEFYNNEFLNKVAQSIYADIRHEKKEPEVKTEESASSTGESSAPGPCATSNVDSEDRIAGRHGKPNSTEYRRV